MFARAFASIYMQRKPEVTPIESEGNVEEGMAVLDEGIGFETNGLRCRAAMDLDAAPSKANFLLIKFWTIVLGGLGKLPSNQQVTAIQSCIYSQRPQTSPSYIPYVPATSTLRTRPAIIYSSRTDTLIYLWYNSLGSCRSVGRSVGVIFPFVSRSIFFRPKLTR